MSQKACIERQGQYWRLSYVRPLNTGQGLGIMTEFFMFWEGAVDKWDRIRIQVLREHKSFKRLQQISDILLSVRDFNFIKKMQKTKCRGITKRQAGYLKGIWERQRS